MKRKLLLGVLLFLSINVLFAQTAYIKGIEYEVIEGTSNARVKKFQKSYNK